MSVLLANLMVNLVFFTLSSIVVFQLQQQNATGLAGGFVFVSLFALIIFSEMLPKDLGVLMPQTLAVVAAAPMIWVMRLLSPILPLLAKVNFFSQRLFFPEFESEQYLRLGDLERAVELSQEDAALLKREQRVLQNIVSLSDLHVEELMRPRPLLAIFRPPVTLDMVASRFGTTLPSSGYLVITEETTEEIASAVSLTRFTGESTSAWDAHSEPVLYIPWSSTAGKALELLRENDRSVAAVVNEYGETIGILTLDDIIETLFTRSPGRVSRLHRRPAIRKLAGQRWEASGLANLRQLARKFGVELPFHESVTLAGLLQEILERFPLPGDHCLWGPFDILVTKITEDGEVRMELRLIKEESEATSGKHVTATKTDARRTEDS